MTRGVHRSKTGPDRTGTGMDRNRNSNFFRTEDRTGFKSVHFRSGPVWTGLDRNLLTKIRSDGGGDTLSAADDSKAHGSNFSSESSSLTSATPAAATDAPIAITAADISADRRRGRWSTCGPSSWLLTPEQSKVLRRELR
uniref:Uncharacterized protein n=1 Tax=Kalanchoe fedtschenkoi TaxID=63787 RepID=A0A7N0U7K3_KALFE